MAESSSMAGPEKGDGVLKSDSYAWGAKVGSNYKSVTVDGEVFWLGDCVRCLLTTEIGRIGKIVKLFEKDGKQMCRIRSFYSPSEFTPALKGLEYVPEPKELFLATGDGLDVEREILLTKIAGRCVILCTAEESFNEVPSPEQVEAADHFFRRAYDPAAEEVVGLDVVEEAIGAQKLFNKKEWLVPVDKPAARSSPQVSASRIQRQSPAVSGSSSHQGVAKGVPASLSEVSPALSAHSAERKLRSQNIDKSVAEPPEVDSVKKTNVREDARSAVSRGKPSAHAGRLVFAIPAPSEVNRSQKPGVMPVLKGRPPTSSAFKGKAMKLGVKGESTSKAKVIPPGEKNESASKVKAMKPVGKAEARRVSGPTVVPVGTNEGAVSGLKRKLENSPGTEEPRKKIFKPTERSNAVVEREKPSKLQKRAAEDIVRGSSPTAEQKPRGKIFKPKQDWDAANLIPAIQNNRVLLLENLAPGLHSDDLAEALTEFFKQKCDVRISPPVSAAFRTTSALLKLPTADIAFKINELMNSRDIIVLGRLVTTSFFKYQDFKAKSSTPFGHIELPKGGRDYNNEDYKDAVATSHLAQGNTIEFDYGLPWRVLDDQHEEQWRMLQEEFNSSKTLASKKMA